MGLLQAAENVLAELEDRYDGAPDSPVLWMGEHICELRMAIRRTNQRMLVEPDKAADLGL